MNQQIQLPRRKALRLKQYDYSSAGAYFLTICVKDRRPLLADVVKPVGVGALDDPQIRLTSTGEIVEKQLLSSEKIPGVKVDRYVIMPDHIHAIVILSSDEYIRKEGGSSRAPTPTNEMLPHVVSTFKRFCHKELGVDIFQRGYMEHIIRDEEDYVKRGNYIYQNPSRWYSRQEDTE